jgi:alpha-L-rhamnosidase
MYGLVVSHWQIKDGTMTLRVEVPANTTATVRLPNATIGQVTETGKTLVSDKDLAGVRQEEGAVIVNVGSGSYSFQYKQ